MLEGWKWQGWICDNGFVTEIRQINHREEDSVVKLSEVWKKLAEKNKEIERLKREIECLKGPTQAERILATDRSNVIP
jgi:hypothetical protein